MTLSCHDRYTGSIPVETAATSVVQWSDDRLLPDKWWFDSIWRCNATFVYVCGRHVGRCWYIALTHYEVHRVRFSGPKQPIRLMENRLVYT